jgi:hypothetical protein
VWYSCSFTCYAQVLLGSVFGRSELVRLYTTARKFIDSECGINEWCPFERLTRCKPSDYFDGVKECMQPYLKDKNGHASSAINGKIKGGLLLLSLLS